MLEVKDLKQLKLPTDGELKLNKLDFDLNKAHAEWEPSKKDSEFDITVSFDLSNDSKDVQATSHLSLVNSKTKKLFKKFLLIEKKLKGSQDYLSFVEDIIHRYGKFVKNNLGQYNRVDFKMQWAAKKAGILEKVMGKLHVADGNNLTEGEVEDIVFKFVDRHEMDNPNFQAKIKLDDQKHDMLRKLYLSSKVVKLYTYGTMKFGFEIMELRFDVSAGFAEIKKKIKE